MLQNPYEYYFTAWQIVAVLVSMCNLKQHFLLAQSKDEKKKKIKRDNTKWKIQIIRVQY